MSGVASTGAHQKALGSAQPEKDTCALTARMHVAATSSRGAKRHETLPGPDILRQ